MADSGTYGLLGDGGQADETEDFARPASRRFRAVTSDYLKPDRPDLIDIASTDADLLRTPVIAAVGAPGLRRELVGLWGGSEYFSVIAATAWVSGSARIGTGALIAPNASVSLGVELGSHVLVNLGGSISHNSVIGDYVTLSPGVAVAGNCRIGAGVFLGIGAVVSHGLSIASGSVIGAGSVVTSDLDVPGLYVGAPARLVRAQEEWLRVL